LSKKISRNQAPEDFRLCLEEYPAGAESLVSPQANFSAEGKENPAHKEVLRAGLFWF
jgi:hypothetical protein